jgi:hypothetical protein
LFTAEPLHCSDEATQYPPASLHCTAMDRNWGCAASRHCVVAPVIARFPGGGPICGGLWWTSVPATPNPTPNGTAMHTASAIRNRPTFARCSFTVATSRPTSSSESEPECNPASLEIRLRISIGRRRFPLFVLRLLFLCTCPCAGGDTGSGRPTGLESTGLTSISMALLLYRSRMSDDDAISWQKGASCRSVLSAALLDSRQIHYGSSMAPKTRYFGQNQFEAPKRRNSD